MSQTLSKDARGFVTEVVSYLKKDAKTKPAMPRMQALLSKVSAQARLQKTAVITSSIALNVNEKTALLGVLKKLFGFDMEIENQISEEIIGGFRIQVGDWVVDTSFESQLRQLADSLLTQ